MKFYLTESGRPCYEFGDDEEPLKKCGPRADSFTKLSYLLMKIKAITDYHHNNRNVIDLASAKTSMREFKYQIEKLQDLYQPTWRIERQRVDIDRIAARRLVQSFVEWDYSFVVSLTESTLKRYSNLCSGKTLDLVARIR